MRWGRSCYISMFPCSHEKIFLMGQIRKIQKNKKERMEKRKKTRFIFIYFLRSWRFPYSCVLHQSRTPLGYCPRATLPQENPLLQSSPTTCHPSQQLLVILPSNPLSSLGGKKIYFLILAMSEKSKHFFVC
jgi:hypothetical protein